MKEALLLLLILAASAASVQGQRVSGRVGSQGRDVQAALVSVVARGSGDSMVARVISDSRGRFQLELHNRAYPLVLKVDGYGYASIERRVASSQELQAAIAAIELRPNPIAGGRIEVTARRECGAHPAEAAVALALWESAYEGIRKGSRLPGLALSGHTFERDLDLTGKVVREAITPVRGGGGDVFVPEAPTRLLEEGYVRYTADGDVAYYAPSTGTLLSSEFIAGHCFSARQRDTGIELRFEPKRVTEHVDVAGELVFNAAGTIPHELVFRYVGPNAMRPWTEGSGGGVRYVRVNGGDLIRSWEINMPLYELRSGRGSVLVGKRVKGGEASVRSDTTGTVTGPCPPTRIP